MLNLTTHSSTLYTSLVNIHLSPIFYTSVLIQNICSRYSYEQFVHNLWITYLFFTFFHTVIHNFVNIIVQSLIFTSFMPFINIYKSYPQFLLIYCGLLLDNCYYTNFCIFQHFQQ